MLVAKLGRSRTAYLPQDAYYRDLSYLPFRRRLLVNFDDPKSLETRLLAEHVRSLVEGRAVDRPVYDFKAHTRQRRAVHVKPKPIILVEGNFVLHEKALRELCDVRVYVEAGENLRFFRRVKRDLKERGRTLDSVAQQYLLSVRPMHRRYVEPSKRYADFVLKNGVSDKTMVSRLVKRIQAALVKGGRKIG